MHPFARHQHRATEESAGQTHGRILDYGWRYDLGEWIVDTLLLRGELRRLRQRTIDLARPMAGEHVLDVGCGTGTLALEVRRHVGSAGHVVGLDPGAQQIARARAKTARRGLPVEFQVGVIEHLPFPDGTFDVVLSTMMMHHLPDDLKREGLAEVARVLEPGGRLLVVDFKRPEGQEGQPASLGAGHRGVQDLPALVEEIGFIEVETGDMQLPRLPGHAGAGAGFLRARKP